MQNWVRRLGRAARLTVYYQLINAIREGRGAQEVRQIFRKNAQNAEFLELLGGELYGKRFDGAVLLRLEEAIHDESVTLTYSGLLTITTATLRCPSSSQRRSAPKPIGR